MKFNKLILIVSLIMIILSISVVSAEEVNETGDIDVIDDTLLKTTNDGELLSDNSYSYYVDNDVGDDSNDGQSWQSSVKTFEKALEISGDNDTIFLANGTYTGDGNTRITIDKSVNIVGSGNTVFDGAFNSYMFIILDDVSVTFKDIKFVNAYKTESDIDLIDDYEIEGVYGAALDIKQAKVTVDNCYFEYNMANYDFMNCQFTYGGAISNFGELTILNSYFYSNAVGSYSDIFGYGGSVYNKGKLLVNKTSFIASDGSMFSNGGAIYNDGVTVMDNSVIARSHIWEESRGSAIFNNGEFTLLNSIIENNTAERVDFNYIYGAIFNSGNFVAIGNIFRNNTGYYKQPNSEYFGSPTIYNVGGLNVSYNAFIDNVGFNGIYNDMYLAGGTDVNINNNWWSTNENPFNEGKVNYDLVDSWIMLNFNPSYSSLKVNESVDITVLWELSSGQTPQIELLPLFNITLSTTVDGKKIISNQILKDGRSNFTFNYTQNKGVYELTAFVNSFNTSTIIDVGKSNTFIYISSDKNEMYFNETITFEVLLMDDELKGVNANISVIFNDAEKNLEIIDGKGKISFSNLSPGNYTVKFSYDGSDSYSKSYNDTSFAVNKIPVTITLDEIGDIKTSDNVTLVVHLSGGEVKGIGQLFINGEFKQSIYLNNGNTSFNFDNFIEGEYNITIVWKGDSNYEAANSSVLFTVGISRTTLNVSSNDTIAGNDAVIIIETPFDNFNSEAILSVNDNNYIIFLRSKLNTITLSNLTEGNYDVKVIFDGNNRFTKANASTSFRVYKLQSKLNVTIENNNLTGKITVKTNSTNITGSIELYINTRYYTADLNNGEAVFDVKFDKGTNYIYVYYDGDKTFEGSSWNTTIGEGENFFIIANNITGYENTDFNYTVQLFEENGMAVPNKNLSIIFNGEEFVIKTNNQGIASLLLNLNVGNYEATAKYANASIKNKISVIPVKFTINASDITFFENEVIDIIFENNITGKIYLKLSNGFETVLEINGSKTSCNLSSLEIGQYDIEAFYTNGLFNSLTYYGSFSVSKAYAGLNITVSDISLGEDALIIVTLPQDATGTIKVTVNGESQVKDITSPELTFKFSDLSAGLYEVDVTYLGNEIYAQSALNKTFSVRDLKSDLILTIDNADYAKELKIIANVNDDAKGNITFKVENLVGVSKIDNGQAVWTFSGVDAGVHTITAYYEGDESYSSVSNSTTFEVYKINSKIELYVKEVYLEENIRIYANLSTNSTGTVTFSMVDYYSPRNRQISNSSVNWYISPLPTGEYTVNAVYNGDNNYYSSNTTFVLVVSQRKSALSVDIGDVGKNDNPIVRVKLTYDDGVGIDGNVNLVIGSKTYRITVRGGTGSLTLGKLSVGTYTFTANFGGNSNYGSSSCEGSFKVSDSLLDSKLSCRDITKYYKGGENLVVALTSSDKPISGATLHVTVNGVKKDYVTDTNGEISVPLSYGVGTYTAVITFDETLSYHGSSAKSVIKVLPTVEGNDVVKLAGSGTQYFATFHDSNGKALANTAVTFTIGSKTYTFTTLPNGIARININLSPGNYVITAKNPVTGQTAKNNIRVYLKIMENKDLTMYYTSGKYYKVRAYGSDGKPVGAGKIVKISVSGKTYNVKTDKNGYASLQINLKPKTYTITAVYDGYKVSNKVVVKPILITQNTAYKKASSYKYSAKVLDANGKILKNKVVTFKFKGKTYKAKTSAYGYAIIYLKVNLGVGKYSIKTVYGKSTNTNTITIKK